jgi:citronellol/citronellal dehydrogenase
LIGEEIRDTTDTSVSLEGETIFMSGGSRGIGLAIARRAARDGANVAEEIEGAGGHALPIVGDVWDAEAVRAAVGQAAD